MSEATAPIREKRKCSVEDCALPSKARGLCNMHYLRRWKSGDPGEAKPRQVRGASIEERFWAYVEKHDGCWLWTGHINESGYGRFQVHRRMVLAHRYSWELRNGPIPEGLDLLHKCDVRPCVNPEHLFPGTNADNVADRVAKGRTRIARGEENPRAKLTAEIVRSIRASGEPQRRIAKRYGIGRGTVSAIIARKIWAHVE